MKCIYCRKLKDDSEFTKEHLIPEPLGGHFVPDLIIGNVCKTCNNNFGLFVDAEFTSNYVIAQKLQLAELALFDKENPSAVSLICMGNSLLSPPQMQDNEICEHWTGPLGEIIYWVRPKDERLSGYAGGNPRTTKDQKSRAYFHFSERTIKYPKITWLAFKNAFKKRSTVKKILNCVINIDPKTIGFTDPDDLDQLRMKFFSDEHSANSIRQVQYPFNPNVGYRFLAKLAIGIGYSLFGEKVLETSYAKELYRALQCRDGDNIPLIHGFFDSSKNQDIKN